MAAADEAGSGEIALERKSRQIGTCNAGRSEQLHDEQRERVRLERSGESDACPSSKGVRCAAYRLAGNAAFKRLESCGVHALRLGGTVGFRRVDRKISRPRRRIRPDRASLPSSDLDGSELNDRPRSARGTDERCAEYHRSHDHRLQHTIKVKRQCAQEHRAELLANGVTRPISASSLHEISRAHMTSNNDVRSKVSKSSGIPSQS